MGRRRPGIVRREERICRTHERSVHRVGGLGPAAVAAIEILEHDQLTPGAVARALKQWEAGARDGRAYLPGSTLCGHEECCGTWPRAVLSDALRGLPRRVRPDLLRLVERADEIYRRETLPDPLADPAAPWWERRQPAGWLGPTRVRSSASAGLEVAFSRASPPWDQLSFGWALREFTTGWAECTIGDQFAVARMNASDLGRGPGHLLRAVTAILLGAAYAATELFAEPVCYRWIFRRSDLGAEIQILRLPDRDLPDDAGSPIWASRQRLDVIGRAVVSGFDRLATQIGEEEYRNRWGRPFPSAELEALRSVQRPADRAARATFDRAYAEVGS